MRVISNSEWNYLLNIVVSKSKLNLISIFLYPLTSIPSEGGRGN
jgi:hypothetical protein